MGLKLGLGLRVRPNPNPLFFFFLLFLFPLKAFTGLGLRLVNPFTVQIRKELFSFLAAPALFPRAVAKVTGVPVTSATPGPFSVSFTRLGLGLHTDNLALVPMLGLWVYLSV